MASRLALAALLALLLLGCEQQATTSSPAITAPESAEVPTVFDEVYIQLQRTPCLGICPDYVVEASAEGHVKYEGYHWVQEIGLHTAEVAPKVIASIAASVLELGFLDLKQSEVDECPSRRSDQPFVILTVRIDGRENTIEYDYGCRGLPVHEMLSSLHQQIDDRLGTARWTDGPDSKKRR